MKSANPTLFNWSATCRFWMGTHIPSWLGKYGCGLFVSRRTLSRMKKKPVAVAPWCLDSGGFTELAMNGKWTVSPLQYAAQVREFVDAVGSMEWAAIQDWMCEDAILAKTGKSVRYHQEASVNSLVELRAIAPDVPWIPVVQGQSPGDYLECVRMYEYAGVNLRNEKLVGVGSVCRRQHSIEAYTIFSALKREGLNLHGFGLKMLGLARSSHLLASADSLAWSYSARMATPLAGHTHKSCANCIDYALMWRRKVLGIHGVVGAVNYE